MGQYESVEEAKRSPELKQYCYEAVDILIKLDEKYKEDVKSVAKKTESTGNLNAGSNRIKSFNVVGKGSTLNLSQKAILDTVVKTAFYANMMSVLDAKPEVKLIISDIIGLSKPNSSEIKMPSYSDPVYLLNVVGITNVSKANLVDDKIIYVGANGINTEIPLNDVKDKIHQYYVDHFDEKIFDVENAIKTVTYNIDVSASNVSSNDIEIQTDNIEDSFIDISQYNESRVNLESEFALLGSELGKLGKLKELGNKKEEPKQPQVTQVTNQETGNQQDASNEVRQEMIVNEPVDAVDNDTTNDNVNDEPEQSSSSNTVTIIIIVVAVIIAAGIIGAAVWFNMRTGKLIKSKLASKAMTGGFVTIKP